MLRVLFSGERAAVWYVLLVFVLPMITLMGAGLVYLWQNDWFIPVAISWLIVTLSGYVVYRLWPEHRRAPTAKKALQEDGSAADEENRLLEDLPTRLDERADWSRVDREVWHLSVKSVEDILAQNPQWQALPELALELLTSVSGHYATLNRGTSLEPGSSSRKTRKTSGMSYRFTLPEMLLVLSITSSRYRQLLLSHVPFAERIRISAILSLYARQNQIITSAGWINNVRRTARLINPLAAVAGELRDQFTNRIFSTLSDKVQNDLKRLLLQELVQVGMDLYSGRLKSTDEELSRFESQSYAEDRSAKAEPIEPLRVVLLGQVSAGKSSLVNALVNVLEAETDILPTTDKTTVHTLSLTDTASKTQPVDEEETSAPADVHLIDTVGLVDDKDSIDTALLSAQQADLLIWVTRATQPARAPEAELNKALIQNYTNDPALRPPPVLLVVSHVDKLSPKAEWEPPYDLSSDERKAQNIKRAIDSCRQQIGLHELTPGIPIALAQQHEAYNVDALIAQILLLRSEAVQVQLNRRRLERDANVGGWSDRWDQASKLGTVTGKLLTRSIFGK